MDAGRTVAFFLLRFGVFYALLVAPWPGVGDAYGRFYRWGAETLFGSTHPFHTVRFVELDPDVNRSGVTWAVDTGIILRIRSVETWQDARSSRYTGLSPTAMVVALILATPISRARRLRGLALGLVLVHLFVAGMLWLVITDWFVIQEPDVAGGAWTRTALRSFSISSRWMGPYYVMPVLIWLLVAFRPEDWIPSGTADDGTAEA